MIAPTDLEVERQFVDGGGTSVAVRWSPPPCTVTGYTLYLNGELRGTVEGPEETSLLLSDVPLNQVCVQYIIAVLSVDFLTCSCS